ncbi:MAG: glycosyltransferase family 2 protein [Microgenomates group bacterium]
MNNLSLILITKNESENVKKWGSWIGKLKNLNELIVVDDNSTDNTLKIVKKLATKKLKVKTFVRHLDNDFSSQRQFAVGKCTNNLILWLDADEYPSIELIEYINHIDTSQYINFAFKRADIFLGSTLHHGENAHQYFLRLFDKQHGYFSGLVHELWVSSRPTLLVNHEINHFSHKTLKTFFEKINFYSEIRSRELYKNKVKSSIWQIIFYPFGKFISDYIFKLGFLDSTAGIIMALGMSFHSFLVRAKLWCLYNP